MIAITMIFINTDKQSSPTKNLNKVLNKCTEVLIMCKHLEFVNEKFS